MFDIGFSELLLVGIVALLVFGPERLPEVARTAALWLGRLRRAMNSTKESLKEGLGTDEIMQQLHNEEVLRRLGENPNPLMPPAAQPAPPAMAAHENPDERS